MSKQKPLPPQKAPKHVVVGDRIVDMDLRPLPPLKQAPSYKEAKPEVFEHCARHVDFDDFDTLAKKMEGEGWELVTAIHHPRYTSVLATFWRRVKKEKAS